MIKTILAALLILSTVSCAAVMEDFGNGEYNEALQQTAAILAVQSAVKANPSAARRDLLLGLYYYPLIIPPYHAYSGPNGLPTWKDVIYEQDLDNSMRDYEYRLKHNLDMKLWEMKMDVQRLIDDLERAKEEAKEKD